MKNIPDREYKGRKIQVRNTQAWGWTGSVTGQRCQTNVLRSCIWLIDNPSK